MDLPAQIPYLFLVWVAAGVLALIDLAVAENRGRLAPRPFLRMLQQWIGVGGVFTVYLVTADAYRHGLLPLWTAILAVALAIGVKLLADCKLRQPGPAVG
jgi:hypothetical protein